MNIAFLSDALFPYNHGGKETRLYEISKRLAKKNHSVKIYCMKWWKGHEKTRSFHGVKHVAIAPCAPLYSGQRRSIRQAIIFALCTFRLLWCDFDVLDVDHMPFLQLFTAKIVCLIKRKPLIATWHEVWGASYWRHYLGFLGIVASFIERMSMALPDYIIAVSKKTADDIQGMNVFMRRLVVIPGGIDIKRIQRVKPDPRRVDIIYAGRILAHKHLDVLVQAIFILKKKLPNLRCLIIGDGPHRPVIEEMIRRLHLRKNITMQPFYSSIDRVYARMKSAKVFALPSSREGFGIAAIEANAAGIPFVTTNEPHNNTQYLIYGLSGKVVNLSPESFANAIDEYLQNMSAFIRHDCIQNAKQYTWDAVVCSTEGVYHLCVN